ncbi:MAG: type I-B CRISPR-associated endonuclease Cas1b [Nitrososphaerota archaeon]
MKKTIYIFSSGEIKRRGGTLCLIKENGEKKYVPVSEVSSLMIFGETTFNKRLLEFLSSNEITLHLFNHYGYYIGSFYPRTHYNSGFMTLKQCEHYLDHEKRLTIACKFVEGSLRNMLKNVTYYHNRKGGLDSTIEFLEETVLRLKDTNSVEELMAIEGQAKEQYYTSFNTIIGNAEYHYEKRERRPPKSRLDTLLSFGNSLLYVTVLNEIYKTHLDPRIGFLHTTNYRKFSLNLDIAEVFKPIIIDRVIFTLTNKKMIDSSCFMEELGGVYLNEKGRKIFVEQYENKLKQTITYEKRLKASYQRIIRLELYKLEKHLIGEKEYTPFISQW